MKNTMKMAVIGFAVSTSNANADPSDAIRGGEASYTRDERSFQRLGDELLFNPANEAGRRAERGSSLQRFIFGTSRRIVNGTRESVKQDDLENAR